MIDPRLPLHIQIRDKLMGRIADRVWKSGEALPGEDRLAEEFSVSVGTMRKVIQGLVHEGVLERKQGKGTFITSTYERNSMLRFVRFTNPSQSRIPRAKILTLTVQEADAQIAEKLDIKTGAKTIYMHRIRLDGDEVILAEHIWLSHKLFSKLIAHLQKESPPLLYPVYDEICGVRAVRALDELAMDHMPDTDAALFNIPAGSACMRIQRAMRDLNGDVIEWRISYVPSDRFHYTVEIR